MKKPSLSSEEIKAILKIFDLEESKKETRNSKFILVLQATLLCITFCFVVLSTFKAFFIF
jgi:hypothetical protein